MNIVSTQFTLELNSLDIYLSGCSGIPKCKGCHNPELWDFNNGLPYEEWTEGINSKVKDFDIMIKNIMVFGGEPLDQNPIELIEFLKFLNTLNKKIWLFTRNDIEEVPEKIKILCDFIKTGRYIEELKTDGNIQYGIKLATSNQKIWEV